MIHFITYTMSSYRALLALTFVIAAERANGQDAIDPNQRPFASLTRLLVDVKTSQSAAEAMAKKLLGDVDKIKADRSAISKAEKLRDQARTQAKAANLKVAPAKWLCNAFGVLHNDPSQCSKAGEGGVWVSVDADGRTSRYTPPTQADRDRAKAAADHLATLEFDLTMKKSNLVEAERQYLNGFGEFVARLAELNKKNAVLKERTKLVEDLRTAYEVETFRTGTTLLETRYAFDEIAKRIGNQKGECVALVKEFAGLGQTSTWNAGDSVKNNTLVPFAPAATFVDGKYPNKYSGNHAVIVLDKSKDGLLVFEQSRKKEASIRLMEYRGGTAANQEKIDKGEAEAKSQGITEENNKPEYFRLKYQYYNPSNDADNYSYIQKPEPKKTKK